MTKSIVLGHHLVPELLAHLEQRAKLPQEGILAGQAVASAVFDLYGFGGGVYNDFDIFKEALPAKRRELQSVSAKSEEARRLNIPMAILDEYHGASESEVHSIGILGSEREGLINYIWCESLQSPTQVVSSFDLNMVEVGIDLKHKRLFWTKAFEYFLKTKQLQLTSLETPFRTLLRYFKKREEFPNIYGDDAGTKKLAATRLTYSGHDQEAIAHQVLTPKTKELALRYQSELQPEFVIRPFVPPQLDLFKVPEDCREAVEPVEVLAFAAPYEDTAAERNKLKAIFRALPDYDAMSFLPRVAYQQALTPSQGDAAKKQWLDEELALLGELSSEGANLVRASYALFGAEYLKGNHSRTHLTTIKRMLDLHPDLTRVLLGLTLDEQYQCVLDLKKRVKAFSMTVLGFVETQACPLDMRLPLHRDAFFERVDEQASLPLLDHPHLGDFVMGDFQVKELITTKALLEEGAALNHCVGGYGAAVKLGISIILSIRVPGDKSRWSTVELNGAALRTRKILHVHQHRGHSNETPHPDNLWCLEELIAQLCETRGYTVKVRSPRPDVFDELLAA